MRNGMVKGKRVGVGILVVALTSLLLVTACASPTTAPSQEKVVEIGYLSCLTGGAATADQPGFMAQQDYVRYFNEEKGIPGVAIEVAWRDTTTSVPGFLSGYRALADRGVLIIYSSQSNGVEAFSAQFEKDQIPVISGSTTLPLVYPPGWVYCAYATQGEVTGVLFNYFMENWKEERPPKLQFYVMDNTFGRAASDEGTKYAQSIGFEVLPLELSSYVIIDATTQLLRIGERGADLVWLSQLITGAGPIMRDAERLGLHDKMQFAGTEWTFGEPLIDFAPTAVEGFLSVKGLPWIDETEVPGIKTMIDTELKYRGTVYKGPEYTGGWVYGAIMCEAVKRAGEEAGYDNIDGAVVKRALENMQNFDIDGIAKVTFGPDDRRGIENYAVYQVRGGKIVRVSNWREIVRLWP